MKYTHTDLYIIYPVFLAMAFISKCYSKKGVYKRVALISINVTGMSL